MISALLAFFENDDCHSEPPLSMKRSISSLDNLHTLHLTDVTRDTGTKWAMCNERRLHKNRILEAYELISAPSMWNWNNVWGQFVDPEPPAFRDWELKLKKKHLSSNRLAMLRERDVYSLSPNVKIGGAWMDTLQEYDDPMLDDYESTMYMGVESSPYVSTYNFVCQVLANSWSLLRMRDIGTWFGISAVSVLSVIKMVKLMNC